MTVVVTHSTPSDGTFSAEGATAWNANHTLSGVGTMAEQNANAVAITGGTATLTSVTTPTVQATNSAGLALKNSAGTTQISMGAGGGDNISLNSSTNINGTNAQIDISPTGTGHVHIKPTGVNSVEIAPTYAGEMDNIVIGGTTPAAGTFTTVDIVTSGTDAEIAPNTGITGWNYSGLSKSVSGEETAPTGLFISPDGLNMYVNGTTGDDVNQYTLSTAFNVSTATFVRLFSTASQDSAPNDIFFKPDGLSMFIMGATNDTVFQYTLSSAFDISTATYASKSFNVNSQESSPTGLWFKPDGTVMYIIGTSADAVFQYTLSTAWDVSTASYASILFSVASQEGTPNQVNLSADGLTMWITGQTGDDITQYALGTAFNVSTAVFENSFYVGFQETAPSGMFIDSTANNRVYLVGSTNDTVFQYNTATNSISAVTDVINTTSNARVQGNLAVQGSAVIDAALIAGNLTVGTTSVSGTLTASSTITLSGSATGSTGLGTSATTGTTTIGGTSQTGTMIVGQSTVSQTTNIQAGATASGSTKTMNIGTAGVSGSTTAINIGSAVSGATSTTTLSGLVVNSISAAVSAAGATQGTATALVSNVNNVTVVAVGADGVRLPTAVAGMRILIRNSDSADILSIYPATGGQINALGTNVASTLVAGLTTELVATTATQWYTF